MTGIRWAVLISAAVVSLGATWFIVPDAPAVSPGSGVPTARTHAHERPDEDRRTAAAAFGWGLVVAGDEFNYVGAPDPARWTVYSGEGHEGRGRRVPRQSHVDGAQLVISGTRDGTTGGMAALFDRRMYGRWETRIAIPAGDDEYHGIALLWPDSDAWPCDGEIDYAENLGDRSVTTFALHYGCTDHKIMVTESVDVTQFHSYAVEWTPTGLRGYIDGELWFEDNDPARLPPGSMHQTLQLDWVPNDTPDGSAQMLVDWVRVYDVAGAG